MVTFLKGGGGQDRFADTLREQLAQSAAQRFMQQKYPEQEQAPQFDWSSLVAPIAGIAKAGIETIQENRQQEMQQEQMMQQAQALAQQLQIPIEQAMQIMQADPKVRQQMIQGLMQEKKVQIEQQNLIQKEARDLARSKELEKFKYDLKNGNKPESYTRMINTFNDVKKLIKAGKVPTGEPGWFSQAWSGEQRGLKGTVGLRFENLFNDFSNLMGLKEGQRSALIEKSLEMMTTEQGQKDWLQMMENNLKPQQFIQDMDLIQNLDTAAQPQQEQQMMETNQEQPQSEQPGTIRKYTGLVASGLGQLAGLPGDIAALGEKLLVGDQSAELLAALDSENPETKALAERFLQTRLVDGKIQPITVSQVPTSTDAKNVVADLFGDYVNKVNTPLEKTAEEIGMDLPFIVAATLAAGPLGGMVAAGRTAVRAGGAQVLKNLGFGEATQLGWRLGSSLGLGGAENAIRNWKNGDGFITGSTKALKDINARRYQIFDKVAPTVKVETGLLTTAANNMDKKLFPNVETYQTIGESIEDIVKNTNPNMGMVRKLYSDLGKLWAESDKKTYREQLEKIREALWGTLENASKQSPKALRAFQQLGKANEGHAAVQQLNFLEKAADTLLKTGSKSLSKVLPNLALFGLGIPGAIRNIPNAAKAVGALGAVYPAMRVSGALWRQGTNFIQTVQGKEAALKYVNTALTANPQRSAQAAAEFVKVLQDYFIKQGDEKALNELNEML